MEINSRDFSSRTPSLRILSTFHTTVLFWDPSYVVLSPDLFLHQSALQNGTGLGVPHVSRGLNGEGIPLYRPEKKIETQSIRNRDLYLLPPLMLEGFPCQG